MTFKVKFDTVLGCLNVSVFAYILTVFWVESLPGWSKLVHVSIVMMLLSLVVLGWQRGIKLRLDPMFFLFWIFLLFAYISVYWSGEQGMAAVRTVSLLVNILGASLVWVALWNSVPLRTVGYAAIAGASIQGGVALQQFWLGGGDVMRFEGLSGNANALAIQLSIAAFLVLVSLHHSFWPPFIAFLFVLIATVVSGSRKIAFVWFVFGLLSLRYIGIRFRTSRLFRIVFLLGLPILVYGILSYSSLLLAPIEGLYVYERIEATIQGEESSADVRDGMAREGLEIWQGSPLYGYGIDQYRYLSSYANYSHNNYTELLVSFGVIGLLLYYSILLVLLFRAFLAFRAGSPYAPLLGSAVLLMLLWDIALVAYSTRLIWLFLGVLGFLSEQQFGTVTTPVSALPKPVRTLSPSS